MIFPMTFSVYIIKQMFKSFLVVGGGLFIFIALLDFIELVSKTSGLNIAFNNILYLELLKIFDILNSIFPYMTIFSIMHAYYSLNRDKEITVARSTGISGLQIVIPAIIFAFTLGLFQTYALNHLGVTTYNQYISILNIKKNNSETILNVSSTGVWLRESTKDGYRIINGSGFTSNPFVINNVNIFDLSSNNKFVKSYSADSAVLNTNKWLLTNTHSISKLNDVAFNNQLSIPTNTTYQSLKNMFKSPTNISFWDLPYQIITLKSIGLDSNSYVYMFNYLLSLPFLYAGMAMIAGFFSNRPYARRQKVKSIVMGVGVAFCVFFYLNLIQSIVSILPFSPVVSGWIPATSIIIFGIYLTLNSEKVHK